MKKTKVGYEIPFTRHFYKYVPRPARWPRSTPTWAWVAKIMELLREVEVSVAWAPVQLRRMAECWDYLRIPLNAEERHQRPGPIPYWGANSIQGYVDEALVSGNRPHRRDRAPFFDRNRPVAFCVDEPIWPNNHIHVLQQTPELMLDGLPTS